MQCETLQALFLSHRANQRAFLAFYREGGKISALSYAQFVSLAMRFAGILETGIPASERERVLVAMENSDLQLIAYAALLLLGATVVPVSPRETDSYLENALESAEARWIVTERERSFKTIVLNSQELLKGASEISEKKFPIVSPAACAAMFFTSGTTSNPKIACLSHESLLANAQALVHFHALEDESRHLCVLPLFHVNAFGFSFLSTVLSGGFLILNHRFHADFFWKVLWEEKAEISSVVPEIIQRLLETEEREKVSLPESFKYFVTAASPLSKQQYLLFTQKFGVKLLQGYGLSEAVNFSLKTPPDLEIQPLLERHARPPAGIPLTGNKVRIRSLDDSRFLSEGETGEIVISGKNLMLGYFRNERASAHALRRNWLYSGDLGYFITLPGGAPLFFVTGRIKNAIKRNSESISLEEVEDEIRKFQGCSEIAAVGFANKLTGEEVGLVVRTGTHPPEISDLERYMKRSLAFHKRPKVVKFVPELPKTGSFKIKRRELLNLFSDYYDTKFTEC